MKLRVAILLICACFSAPLTWSADKSKLGKNAEALTALLADENFKVREGAALDLWKLGAESLPALKDAAADPDPEKSMRARDIARRIELGITPETQPIVIELADRYASALPEEKSSILGKLKTRRAWRQMLKLFARESSADVRSELDEVMDGVALTAAREAIFVGDMQSAREYLELGAIDESGRLAHADFLRGQGILDQELKKLPAGDAKFDSWRLALLRASGKTRESAELAQKSGSFKTAALMTMIEGDPLPWLELAQKAADESPYASAYAAAAADAWKGKPRSDAVIAFATESLNSKSSTDRDNALNALHALGRFDLAEVTLTNAHPLIAFQYFDIIERSTDAIGALGLKEDASDGHEWIAKLLGELTKDDIGDQREPSTAMERLAALAYFNERRGLDARNDDLFLQSGNLISETNPELFLRILSNFFGRGEVPHQAPKLAWRMASKWAGQEQKRWEAVVATVLGDEDVVSEWWEWLGELDPESGASARCDAMLVVFKARNDTDRARIKIIDRVWQSIDAAQEDGRPRLLARMLTMAIASNDLDNILRALDRLPEKTRAAVPWESRLVWLSAVNRWDEAASLILSQINDGVDSEREPSAEIHAYAASCLRKAGRAKEAAKHDRLANVLALGDPGACLRIANGYAFGDEFQSASEWKQRALMYADPDDEQDDIAMLVRSYADDLLERSDWSKAGAAFEVLNFIVIASEPRWQSPSQFGRVRLHADMSRALGQLKSDRKAAIDLLGRCHRNAISDGSLADYFLPALRKAGLSAEHDQWFLASWNYLRGEISKFPNDDHLRNTAAWFASRAMRELDAAEKDIAMALELNPDQAAYLDTMAELLFAKGDRAKAIEWSNRAMRQAPIDDQIRRQSARFRSGAFPIK